MKDIILVMGGSFNPPTIAHLDLMLTAVDALHAKKGIFVPAGGKYLRRKMRKAGHPEEVLPDFLRLEMVAAMADTDPRLEVEDVEILHPKGWYTFETLSYIHEKYPEAQLYSLIGDDKLDLFLRAHRLEPFLEKFGYAVFRREVPDMDAVLRENETAWARREKFLSVPTPEGVEGISSTLLRQRLRAGDPAAAELVHPGVWEKLKDYTFPEI